ncbi:hypothetical protein HRbin23_01118 [bacterium HR23]|nr:hypothetical protein HRbin23_01118 [bacterium HR23]
MSRWLLVGIGAGIGVLVVVALVVTFTLRRPLLYPPDTPQGVTQRYLQALAREQWAEAYGYLSSDLQARCPLDAWERQVAYARSFLEQSAVFLQGVTYRDDGSAVVRVTFAQPASPRPFAFVPQEWGSEQEFRLKYQDGGQWRFTAFPWPLWPDFQCPAVSL